MMILDYDLNTVIGLPICRHPFPDFVSFLTPITERRRRSTYLDTSTRNLMDPLWTDSAFLLALERFGYDIAEPRAAVIAFQRRFRPELIDGVIDGECRAILLALLLPKPRGDE